MPQRSASSAAIAGWLFAAAAVVIAIVAWSVRSDGAASAARTADPAENRSLRLALATARSENVRLRFELAQRLEEGPPAPPAVWEAAPPTPSPAPRGGASVVPGPVPTPVPLATRLRTALEAESAETSRRATRLIAEATERGTAGLVALLEAWRATGDPRVRLRLLPAIVFLARGKARPFLVAELGHAENDGLRIALLEAAVRHATPRYAEAMKPAFLASLVPERSLEERRLAIAGLRYARGPGVREALVRLTRDDEAEPLRAAALRSLAARPAATDGFLEALGREPSADVRELASCERLVSGSPVP